MRLRLEDIDHIKVINWFNHEFPELSDDLHHFANERKCSLAMGKKLKTMGVKRGVSDFFLGVGCGGYHGLWIELKVGNGRLSPEQRAFIERKLQRGYFAIAAWGFDATKEIIKTYLDSSRTKCFFNMPKNCS